MNDCDHSASASCVNRSFLFWLQDGERCTSLRVAGEERAWKVGEAVLFDDSFLHEVWNNCTEQRLVLQAVFAHPDLVRAGDRQQREL